MNSINFNVPSLADDLEPQYDEMDVDEPPGPSPLQESDTDDSDDEGNMDSGSDGWESDEDLSDDVDEWNEGDEPWQQGLSQGDRLGGIFEAEAARAGTQCR
jgi:hypothetical protein